MDGLPWQDVELSDTLSGLAIINCAQLTKLSPSSELLNHLTSLELHNLLTVHNYSGELLSGFTTCTGLQTLRVTGHMFCWTPPCLADLPSLLECQVPEEWLQYVNSKRWVFWPASVLCCAVLCMCR
jgi:hypothetical protein